MYGQLNRISFCLFCLSSLTKVLAFGENLVRLSGGKYFEGGFVEIWKDGAWRGICDPEKNTWDKNAGDVVCHQLGFMESLNTFHGNTQLWTTTGEDIMAAQGVECIGEEASLSLCKITPGTQCPLQNRVSVLCKPESKSACGPGATAFLGSCYKIHQDTKIFPEAQQECQKSAANLVEITSELENLLVGTLVEKTSTEYKSFWTGGVVNEILHSKFKIWHGSQKQITFDNHLDVSGAADKPKGIVFKGAANSKSPAWEIEDFDSAHAFICKYDQADIGCLEDDDVTGVKYQGQASHDRDGNKCVPWDRVDPSLSWTHNFCRNPDEDAGPYCYLESGEPSECNIFTCGANPKNSPSLCDSESVPQNGNIVQSPTVQSSCHKEEYSCRDRSCILKDYVCDGVKDCPDGDDEEECRVMSSLFSKESGYKLEGVTSESESDSIKATEEECAKLCLYKKQDASGGCCNSFSHRPGKDGKDDRCILGTVYENQAFDSLVQKKSWNYYKLNISQESRNCRNKRPTGPLPIEGKENKKKDNLLFQLPFYLGLRLMNRRRGINGNIVEVKLNGEWGGICDDGFNIKEGNVVCHQLGFHLGAKRVVKKANPGGEGKILLGQVSCAGSEKSLSDCDISDKPTLSCGAEQRVAVECKETETVCEDTEFHCNSGECIGIDNLCDGIPNQCKDGSDENTLYCNSPPQVRLSPHDGHSGLLEVRHKGVWGTVCEDNFGQNEADVFCKMLGYERAEEGGWREVDSITSRDGSWPVWINFKKENSCDGNESSITECHDSSLWNHDYTCRHIEDIHLTCKVG